MDQVALLGDESESEYSSDDSDEEGYDSSARDYKHKWFHPDNIGKNGVMSSKLSRTAKVVRPTNYLNEFQRNALTVTMCIIAVFLTIKVGSSPVPSVNNVVDWTLNGEPYDAYTGGCNYTTSSTTGAYSPSP